MKNSLGRASSNSASNKICQFSGPMKQRDRLLLAISQSVTTGAKVIAPISDNRGSLVTYEHEPIRPNIYEPKTWREHPPKSFKDKRHDIALVNSS